jgi:hypothetical protein
MYEVFDSFWRVKTWPTQHDDDLKRFYLALHKVVNRDDFSADEMGEYLREKIGASRESYSGIVIGHYVSYAWAVRDYLRMNGLRS